MKRPVPTFYLAAVRDPAVPGKVAAVLVQPLSGRVPAVPSQILAEWEWGEREVLRWLQGRGLFDPGEEFVPLGPDARAVLRFLAERLGAVGLRQWGAGELETLIKEKRVVELPAVPRGGEAAASYLRGEYDRVLALLDEERAAALVSP